MDNHVIEVTFNGTLVHAEPNPLPERVAAGMPEIRVKPGDTVTWHFIGNAQGRNLEVAFNKVSNLTQEGDVVDLKDVDSNGPFMALSTEVDRVTGTIKPDVSENIKNSQRFFYKIFEKGQPLDWDNPVQGAPNQSVGGGIDNPRTPP